MQGEVAAVGFVVVGTVGTVADVGVAVEELFLPR